MLVRLKGRDSNARLDPDLNDGAYLPEDDQEGLAAKRSQKELSRAWTTANISMVLNLVLGGALALSAHGWRKADDRWANDVKVAWVKVLPSGQTQVEYYEDAGNPNRFFEATINASLINYVEHRFRRRRESVEGDYGYALQFMGDSLRSEFLDKFKAAKVAADLAACASCDLSDVHVTAIDHNVLITPDRANAGTSVIESTVYFREVSLGRGAANNTRNRRAKLTWAFRPVAEVSKNLPALKANPLGMQILSERVIDDLAQGGPT